MHSLRDALSRYTLQFWVVHAGVQAQLLAVGLSSGEVALYKLWNIKGGEPVRIISLADWGFEPETTGSVAELQWSPDNRAIAVSTIQRLCSAHAYSSTTTITSIPDAGGLEAQRLGAVDAVGMPPGMLAAPSQGASRRPAAQPQ